MDENQIEGTVREYGGVSRRRRHHNRRRQDASLRAMNEAAGAAQKLYGQTDDTARQAATTLDSWLRNAIETQPYRLPLLHWELAGCSAECADPCNQPPNPERNRP